MRSFVWLMAFCPALGCTSVEVDALSPRPMADLATEPPSDPPDMGRPQTPRCSMRRQGDGRTCQSSTLWKLSAQQDCRSRGERLDVLMPFDPCGLDRYRVITYTCCTQGPPPPPPPGPMGTGSMDPASLAPLPPNHETPDHGGLES